MDPNKISPQERLIYDQQMAKLLYQTYHQARKNHGFKDSKPWMLLPKNVKHVWFEVAHKMMDAADMAEKPEYPLQ